MQWKFLSSRADITIGGGAAGSGKSYGLLADPLRFRDRKGFAAVIFRRTMPEITNPGGLCDEARNLYPSFGGLPREGGLEWVWPSGAKISFDHLQHETDVMKWHGSQVPLIEFDELTTFTSGQFWYLLSRNRSLCGVNPYIRASCNPDPDSWVADLLEWWIDQDTGFPIHERAGALRYFMRVGEELQWADKMEDLFHLLPEDLPEGIEPRHLIKSLTFIPGRITDNKYVMKANPEYYGWLMSMPPAERDRLLYGNWKIKSVKGLFDPDWFLPVAERHEIPYDAQRFRFWDLAATEVVENKNDDPDWTVGTKLAHDKDTGRYWVEDVIRERLSPAKLDSLILNTAREDGEEVPVCIEEEGGSGGKITTHHFATLLDGFIYRGQPTAGKSKIKRAKPFASMAENGLVKLVRAKWNRGWLERIRSFGTENAKDDEGDSASGAYVFSKGGFRQAGVIGVSIKRKPMFRGMGGFFGQMGLR